MNINVDQFQEMMDGESEKLCIIDVRELDEFSQLRISESKLIPLSEIISRKNEIDWNKKVIIVCRSGARGSYAVELLQKEGKKVFNLEGGINELQSINCKHLEY